MFCAALIKDTADDPGVYADFKYRREALLFDLGGLGPPPPGKILKKIQSSFPTPTRIKLLDMEPKQGYKNCGRGKEIACKDAQ